MAREKRRDVPTLQEEIVDPDVNYRPRPAREKEKKVWHSPWKECPFCGAERSIKKESEGKQFMFVFDREPWCDACGAKEIPECPACRHSTWVDKDGYHRHNSHGCGFYGKKR
jgi:transposase-like protein